MQSNDPSRLSSWASMMHSICKTAEINFDKNEN